MNETITTTRSNSTDESKSLSLLRQFLRFAISSVVYHRVRIVSSPSRTTNGAEKKANKSGRDSDCSLDNLNAIAASESESSDTITDLPTQPPSPFVEKNYCGMKGLKYMDAVANDGTVIDENVHRISQWIEKGVLPYLHRLNSLKFCTLSTHMRSPTRKCTRGNTGTSTTYNTPNIRPANSGTSIRDEEDVGESEESSTILEMFRFQFMPEADDSSKPTGTGTTCISQNKSSCQKSVMGQLKSALEKVMHNAEKYGTTSKKATQRNENNGIISYGGPTISTMNIVLEFRTDMNRDQDNNDNCENREDDVSSEDGGNFSPVQPELFSKSTVSDPLKMIQRRGENELENAIIEIDEYENDHDDSNNYIDIGNRNNKTPALYNNEQGMESEFESRDFAQYLGQNSQNKDALNQHCQHGVGRREIARMLLPHRSLLISRECMVLNGNEAGTNAYVGNGDLNQLFLGHLRQVVTLVDSKKRTMSWKGLDNAKFEDQGICSPIGKMGADPNNRCRKKRKHSTPPLTPMRLPGIRHNEVRGSSSNIKLHVGSVKTNHSGRKDHHQHKRTPVFERGVECVFGSNGTYHALSPIKSSLFVTPKNIRGMRCSPRSSSPSEAPTYVVPMSSGRKSSATPLSTYDHTPGPRRFELRTPR